MVNPPSMMEGMDRRAVWTACLLLAAWIVPAIVSEFARISPASLNRQETRLEPWIAGEPVHALGWGAYRGGR